MEKVSQAAVRDITRKLQRDIRNDWEFPRPSVHTSISPLASDVDQYRERYYGTTDDSDNEEGLIMRQGIEEESEEEEEQDPYRFNSPDAVAGVVEGKRQARKRKRKERLEEEIKINPGLCFFLARRNAWTGAKSMTEVEGHPPPSKEHVRQASTSSDSGFSSANTENTAPSSPGTGSAESPTPTQMTTVEEHLRMTSISQQSREPPSPFDAPDPPSQLTDVLVPITRPLIPHTNPVRMSMYGRQQSELYDKIVRDTRSPAIPINLAHMTRVIVQGWKDEGNWPPQSSLPEPSIASSRRGGNLALGSAVIGGADNVAKNRVRKTITIRSSRVDGGRRRSTAAAGAESTAQRLENGDVPLGAHGIFTHHPGRHIRQGIDGVKRVLRLSGSHGSSSRPKSTDSNKTTGEPMSPRSPKSPLSPKSENTQPLNANGD